MTARQRVTLAVSSAAIALVVAFMGGTHLLASGGPPQWHGSAVSPYTEPSTVPAPVPTSATSPSSEARLAASPSAAHRQVPSAAGNLAAQLRTLPAGTRQVIIVSTAGYGTSTATLQTFTKRDGSWLPALGAMPARIGARGFRDTKVEGDLATPTGVYSIGSTMYGIAANPGVRYAYHRVVEGDYWNENPDTPGYNSFQHGADPGGASEALWEISPQYNYFAVINYNIPVRPADPPRGSGIFLHVMVAGQSTAGCVAVSEANLVRVLRWLDPAAAPRIVMAPASELDRY